MPTPKYTAHYPDLYRPLWFRVRFYSHDPDPRPVSWPPPGPYWNSGTGEDKDGNDVQIIIVYTKEPNKLKEYWPEGRNFDCPLSPEPVRWHDLFPKPDWVIDDV
jgi:hypothetical protein